VRVPIGFMGELDAGYVAGDDAELERSAFFVRSRFYYRRTDVSLLVVGFRENLLLGFDFTRAIAGAGVWLEGAQTLVGLLDKDKRNSDLDYFRCSLGLDYSLRNGTYLFGEYHYNQAGAADSEDYLQLFQGIPFTEGAVYFLGEHYLIAGIVKQITPLIIANGELLANLYDRSLLFAPSVEYNIAENIYLAGGGYLGLGSEPGFELTDSGSYVPELRSEFGAYPDIYFLSFRVYF
jgi:hypothetical protein